MEEEAIKKAEVLIEAYPYIKQYKDSIFVIKVGGSILRIQNVADNIIRNIAFLEVAGIKVIVVCGGGPFITEEIEKKGKKPVFIDGLRVTDKETLEIVENVLFEIRDKIVRQLIEKLDVEADKLSPDENFAIAQKIHYQKGAEVIDLGFVGQIKNVNSEYINRRLGENRVLVLPPLISGDDGYLYNVNGDSVAFAIAEAIKAEKLIFITDVAGVMRNPENPDTLISVLHINEAEDLIEQNVIKGGMLPKVKAGISAIKKGVKKVHIISGSIPNSIILEVFTELGVGTEILV
ncbi:MAG: acetylglutamate kinase [Candidatus Omnitrophica bacterium]|nr:acetylglutamate kinase [Candidatus Omnitrophota bacterium]MCM8776742.1 acetylglutamate kinase [Candidatus Omnitrophota bacterium]